MAARTSTGTYTATANSFNPAVTGTTIDAAAWNAILDEIEVEITDAVSRSGKGGMLADLDMSSKYINNLASASLTHQAVNLGIVQTLSANLETRINTLSAAFGGGSGAPANADYIVLSANGTLSVERVLTMGTGMTANDAGAGGAYTLNVLVASAADYWAATAGKILETSATWEAAKFVSLTDAATVTANFAAGINFTLVLGGNRTLKVENAKDGQKGSIYISQSGGARTLAYSSMLRFAGGTAPALSTSLSTASGAWDILTYDVLSANFIAASMIKNVK